MLIRKKRKNKWGIMMMTCILLCLFARMTGLMISESVEIKIIPLCFICMSKFVFMLGTVEGVHLTDGIVDRRLYLYSNFSFCRFRIHLVVVVKVSIVNMDLSLNFNIGYFQFSKFMRWLHIARGGAAQI